MEKARELFDDKEELEKAPRPRKGEVINDMLENLEKNGDPKIKEEFDKYFNNPTAVGKRKTTLPTKYCPFTRRNLKIPGIKYSTARKKGKKIAKRDASSS